MSDPPVITHLDDLLERAAEMIGDSRRSLLGIAGPPGAGKSTLAGWLERSLADRLGSMPTVVAQVPMDGFHHRNSTLRSMGATNRKGAPDTFDVSGYLRTLDLVRTSTDRTILAPSYSRVLHEPVPDTHTIPPSVRLVISEGNYLLLTTGDWPAVTAMFDKIWFLTVDREVARKRLIRRQIAGGRSPEAARDWVDRSDMTNLDAVNATTNRADLLVHLPATTAGGYREW